MSDIAKAIKKYLEAIRKNFLVLYIVIGGFNAGYSYCTTIDENSICNPDVYDKNDSDAVLLYRHMLNVGSSLYENYANKEASERHVEIDLMSRRIGKN
jgi:hypothetical protein